MNTKRLARIIDLFPGLRGIRAGFDGDQFFPLAFLEFCQKRNLSHGEWHAAQFILSVMELDSPFYVRAAFSRWDSTYRAAWVEACGIVASCL